MFLALWYYLQGYVIIKVSGFAVERFMNMLSYRGVYLWGVETDGAGVKMKAPRKSLDVIYQCGEKTGCRVNVLSAGGLSAKTLRFRGRHALTAGIFIFAAGLYILSSFVWIIKIEGNERVLTEDILAYSEEIGLRPGVWKRGIAPDEVTKGILAEFPDISWVSVGIEGTAVEIKIAETIEKTPVVDKEVTEDIIASHDGVITQITAERGTPLVKEGDVVAKGDILISSEVIVGLEGEEQHTEYVAAEGIVTARIWLTLKEELPLVYEEKIYTGEIKTNFLLSIADKEADIIQPDMEGFLGERELIYEKNCALGDFKLPLVIKKEQYKLYTIEERERSVEEAKAILKENITKKAERQLSDYGTIESTNIHFEEFTDCVTAEGQAVIIERIGEKTQAKGRDAIDGANGKNDTD